MDKKYWLVGATYGNEGDQAENFVSGGYWMLGWKENDALLQMTRCNKIRPGDRIAIKKLQGQGATQMTIRFVGIVRGIIPCDYSQGRFICTVNWCNTKDFSRVVDVKHGCLGSIHGPFVYGDDPATDMWIESIFRI